MKEYTAAILLCLVFVGTAEAQTPTDLPGMIAYAKSDEDSDRIHAFQLLGKYWDQRPRTASAGFSDTPVEAEAPVPKEPATEEQIDAIASAIKAGMTDDNPDVRKAAAIALCSAPRSSKAVMSAVETGLKSEDATVVWYTSQQAKRTPPKFASVIESLIVNLGSDDFNKFYRAAELIGNYGSKARPYAKQIVDIAVASVPEERYSRLYVLFDIGLTDEAADALAEAAINFSDDDLAIAAICLLDFPEKLKALQASRPELIAGLERHRARLLPYLCMHQYEPNATRDWLASAMDLPPNIMGMLGESRFIDEIAKHEADASAHQKTFLEACKRACGAKAEMAIEVDSSHPVEFRPASAWPKSDERRKSKNASGHGDGATSVMVTGEIKSEDGTHPESIKFIRTNDGMLMGTKRNDPEPVMYDKQSGRFAFLTSVFAAYSMGKDQPEPGPYQTGSAQIRIEAPGLKPLVVQFFDEMPDVQITLEKGNESPNR
ncbi:MAG: hypothetical protein WBD20_09680 [Pirellulaceae bacterium]